MQSLSLLSPRVTSLDCLHNERCLTKTHIVGPGRSLLVPYTPFTLVLSIGSNPAMLSTFSAIIEKFLNGKD